MTTATKPLTSLSQEIVDAIDAKLNDLFRRREQIGIGTLLAKLESEGLKDMQLFQIEFDSIVDWDDEFWTGSPGRDQRRQSLGILAEEMGGIVVSDLIEVYRRTCRTGWPDGK